MKVQRVRLSDHYTWLVLDDEYRPVPPILAYLKFLDNLDRSPNTIRATAQHLKAFWLFLREQQTDWTEVDVAGAGRGGRCGWGAPGSWAGWISGCGT